MVANTTAALPLLLLHAAAFSQRNNKLRNYICRVLFLYFWSGRFLRSLKTQPVARSEVYNSSEAREVNNTHNTPPPLVVSLGTLAHIQHKNEKNRCTWECGVAYFNFPHPLCPTILTEILVPPSPTNLRAGGVMLYLVPPRLHGGVWSCYTLYPHITEGTG